MNLFNGNDAGVLIWTAIGVVAFIGLLGSAVAFIDWKRRRHAETMRRLRNEIHFGLFHKPGDL